MNAADAIAAWEAVRKPPLRLNLQDPIVFTSYGAERPAVFVDPRVYRADMRRVASGWRVFLWLEPR